MAFWRRGERIARAADAWVARLQFNATDADRKEFEAWRSADPRHEAAFKRSQGLWAATGSATRTSYAPSFVLASPARTVTGSRLAIASIVAVIAAGSGALLIEHARPDTIGREAQVASGAAPRTVRLADGSAVELGPDSEVATHFDGATRGIVLVNGTARFRVAHDAAHPFVVTAGDRTVTARGTVFDVALRPEGLVVTMVEGVVDVGRKQGSGPHLSAPIRLRRGDRLVSARGHDMVTAVIQPPTSRNYPSTPIADVLRDAEGTATKPIRLQDATMGSIPIEGRFDLSNTRTLAQQLAAALSLDVREERSAFILSRPRPIK